MATELLERSVQELAMVKCSAHIHDKNDLVDISTLGTPAFKGYESPFGGIYCCEKHYDDTIDQ